MNGFELHATELRSIHSNHLIEACKRLNYKKMEQNQHNNCRAKKEKRKKNCRVRSRTTSKGTSKVS